MTSEEKSREGQPCKGTAGEDRDEQVRKTISLRPVNPADDDFILSVYASTRAAELAQVPWSPEQKDAFVRMQFVAQKQHYAATYPKASHEIICTNEGTSPVGRIYMDRGADALHILDITILPPYRNAGIGSFLLRQLMAEAAACGKPVTIYVESFNPALGLFAGLGFQKDQEQGFHFLMKWSPGAS